MVPSKSFPSASLAEEICLVRFPNVFTFAGRTVRGGAVGQLASFISLRSQVRVLFPRQLPHRGEPLANLSSGVRKFVKGLSPHVAS